MSEDLIDTQQQYLLLLPTQLFEKGHLSRVLQRFKQIQYIVLYEHHHYFSKYAYNKKKLLLHRSSMDYYYQYLKEHFENYQILYVATDDKITVKQMSFWQIVMYDPVDKIELKGNITIIDTPAFLLTHQQCVEYRSKYKGFQNHNFYKFVRNEVDILRPFKNLKSYDKDNRKAMPLDTKIPKIKTQSDNDLYFINKHKKHVNSLYKDNIGSTEDSWFAVTHDSAKKVVSQFLRRKLVHFGDYQDFIMKENPILFHSSLSIVLNIGLITPEYVIKQLIKFIAKFKVKINNTEAFIRQIGSWRETQRYCYLFADFNQNFFKHSQKLTVHHYRATTNIEIVDHAIEQSIRLGYSHHIVRLMVLGNYFNISQINPNKVFSWFMEIFLDAYEFVMHQNVYGMALFSDGGQTSSKPYICSSNYLLKMSNYPRGLWCEQWDELLRSFIKKNKTKLKHIYGMNWTLKF